MATYRVVLADHHLLFPESMKLLIERMPDVEVVGEAGDGLELLQLLRELVEDLSQTYLGKRPIPQESLSTREREV